MCAEAFLSVDINTFEKDLISVISNAQSLDEIEVWLKSQQCVKSLKLEGYLLKSNPPQRDFVVDFKMQDGSIVSKIVNIYDLGNRKFQFHKICNQ
jgi:hypothetical protein